MIFGLVYTGGLLGKHMTTDNAPHAKWGQVLISRLIGNLSSLLRFFGLSLSRQAAFAFLFFSARNLAQIFALAAADNTRFLTWVTSRTVLSPSAFAAPVGQFKRFSEGAKSSIFFLPGCKF